MDPYLEHPTVWHDFHERFCPALAEILTSSVRPHYIVKIDEHVYIHELDETERALLGRGDVTVGRGTRWREQQPDNAAVQTLPAPSRVGLPAVDTERISFVEIRDRESMRLVTVIELLSPTNKQRGPDREQYLAKRALLLQSTAHFVELDLLRGEPRLPLENLPSCDYYAVVSRYEDRPTADLWPLFLRDRLPLIPIPLSAPHPDAQVDLQAILDRVYEGAGYEDYIYRNDPEPPLPEDDMQWARAILAST